MPFHRQASARVRSQPRGGHALRTCEEDVVPPIADDALVGRGGGREPGRVRTRKEEEERMSIRKLGANKRWPLLMVVAMFLSGISPSFMPQSTVSAQVVTGGAPVGQGFVIDAGDLRFIYEQILVAQAHAAGGTLLGPGPDQVSDPHLPRRLRTVDGSYTNLVPVPDQPLFGAADQVFPRLTTPLFRDAEPFSTTLPGGNGAPTSYREPCPPGDPACNPLPVVVDSQPRLISNLIVDQTDNNPAAHAAW